MHKHQSLNEAINQLKSLKIPSKKPVTPPANDRFRRKVIPLKTEKPTYISNPPQSTHLHPASESYYNKTSLHVKPDSTSVFNKSAINPKPTLASIYSPSSPRIIRPNSARAKENASQKSKFYVHLPDTSSSHGSRDASPRFSQSTTSVQSIENTESKINIPQETKKESPSPKAIIKAPENRKCLYRVRFENYVLTRFKKYHANIYYKFGIRLLENSDFEARAVRYLKIAADQGHLKAILRLASIYYDGYMIEQPISEYKNSRQPQTSCDGIKKGRKEAAKYYKMATDLGDLDSMRKYRTMLYDGDGVKKDRKAAALYYKADADRGIVSAITKYATMCYLGEGVDEDYDEAARYFKMAVDKGDPYGIRMYAYLYQHGCGVKYDLQEALRYYQMAADLGDETALKDLIKMLDNGAQMFMHSKDAAKYYKLAADKGDAQAAKKYKLLMLRR